MVNVENIVIGYYHNQDNQQYCTVIVKTDSFFQARIIQMSQEENNECFRASEKMYEISDEELATLQEFSDIWNQVNVIDFTPSYDNFG